MGLIVGLALNILAADSQQHPSGPGPHQDCET
jgi:hypothetical protein